MKLKDLITKAQKAEYPWLAVDKNNQTFGYIVRPELDPLQWNARLQTPSCSFLGMYTGNKDWKTTLRQVPKDGTTR